MAPHKSSPNSPSAILDEVSNLLARASRCRESDDLNSAERHFGQAARLFATAGNPLSEDDPDYVAYDATYRQLVVSLGLVEATLRAHERSAPENVRVFAPLLITAAKLSPVEAARVECCWGAVALFQRDYAQARLHLTGARNRFRRAGYLMRETVQASYHLARLHLQCNRPEEAIAVLSEALPSIRRTGNTDRYVRMATTLLIVTLRQCGRKQEADELLAETELPPRAHRRAVRELKRRLRPRRFGIFFFRRAWPDI